MLEKLKIEKQQTLEYLIAIEGVFSMNPYFFWEGYKYSFWFDMLRLGLDLLIVCFFFLGFGGQKKRISKQSFFMMVSFALMYTMYVMNDYISPFTIPLGALRNVVMISVFLLLSEQSKINIFKYFTIMFAITIIPAIIYSSLHFIGITIPYDVIEPSHEGKKLVKQAYTHYFGAVYLENTMWRTAIKRACAIYDEHGMLGTVAALLIVGNRFEISDKKNRKLLILLVLGGVVSFSMAFFVIILLYYSYMLITNKNKKSFAFLVVILIGVILIIYFLRNNSYVQQYILKRFDMGYLASYKRADSAFRAAFSEFMHGNDVLFGKGNHNPLLNIVDASSPTVLIYCIGIVGFCVYCGWFLFWGIKSIRTNTKYSVFFMVVFTLSFMQRPWIHYLYFLIILLGALHKTNLCSLSTENMKTKEKLKNASY